jgi:hypothetical protein
MRKHLTIIVLLIIVLMGALVVAGHEIVARRGSSQGGSSSSTAPGYHIVSIAEMGISLELPDGWTDGVTSDPMRVRIFADTPRERSLMIVATPARGRDFTAALADADTESGTAYEGEPSIKVEREDPLTIAGMPGALRHRELLAAGMHDLAAVFELEDHLFTISLHHDDGSDPTDEDEQLLRKVASSMKPVR